MFLKVSALPSGLLIAAAVLWDGDGWHEVGVPAYGPSPVAGLMQAAATLLGCPVVVRERGWRGKGFAGLFYDSFSAN